MKIPISIGAVVLVGSALAFAAKPDQAKVCGDLNAFEASVKQIETIGPQTTIGQIKTIDADVNKSYEQFVKASEKDAPGQTDNLKKMVKELGASAKKTPDSATLEQAMGELQDEFQQVQMASDQLMAKLACPPAEPHSP